MQKYIACEVKKIAPEAGFSALDKILACSRCRPYRTRLAFLVDPGYSYAAPVGAEDLRSALPVTLRIWRARWCYLRKWAKIIRVVLIAIAIGAVAFAGFWWWLDRELEKTFAGLGEGLGKLADVGLGTFAQIVVIQRDDPVRQQLEKTHDLITAYEADPAAFKENANLVLTWNSAARVSEEVFRSEAEHSLPFRSDRLALQDKDWARDGWGNLFCVSGSPETLVIISAGTGRQLDCKFAGIERRTLAGIPRSVLIKTDTGYLVMLVDKPADSGKAFHFELPKGKSEVQVYVLNDRARGR